MTSDVGSSPGLWRDPGPGAVNVARADGGRPAWSRPVRSRPAWSRAVFAVGSALALLWVTAHATGLTVLISMGTFEATVRLMVPILFAGLGGLWAERAGVITIGLEGMMILGTWGGAWAGWLWGPWVGLVAAGVFGLAGGLVHATATVIFGVDHIVSGVVINLLAVGVTKYLTRLVFEPVSGSPRESPPVPKFDTAVSPVVILAFLLVPVTYLVLWRTRFGLRLRACGESPAAAASVGVAVVGHRCLAMTVSGALAGLGGAALVLSPGQPGFLEGQTGGRGFIGLAAMIFGNWRPGGLLGGAALFGYADALRLRDGGTAVHGLLYGAFLLLLVVAVRQLARRSPRGVSLAVLAAASLYTVYWFTEEIPQQLTAAVPHLLTLVVLACAAGRLRPPAAAGLDHRPT